MALVLDENGNLTFLDPTPGTPGQIVQYALTANGGAVFGYGGLGGGGSQ